MLYALYADRCKSLLAKGTTRYDIIADIHNK